MKVLLGVLEEERDRVAELGPFYRKKVAQLPKGYISVKKIKGREYAYLSRRVGARIRSEYLGHPDDPKVKAVRRQIEERRQLEKWLREMREDVKIIERVLRAKRRKV